MKTCYLIVPAWSDQAGQCRIVARSHEIKHPDPLGHYRQFPAQWREVGLMNSQGKLVCLDAPASVVQEFRDCEPLMASLVVYDDATETEAVSVASRAREIELKTADSKTVQDLATMAAVQQDGHAIQFLAEAQRTPEVCLAAVQKRGHAIKYISDEQRTPEVCLVAVQKNGYAIEYLTAKQRTPEVILAAVQQNGYAIEYLTEAQRTPEVCLAAVQQSGHVIESLTAKQRTPEVILAAVQQNGFAIMLLTEAQSTPEVCLAAVEQNPRSAQYLRVEDIACEGALVDSLRDALLLAWGAVEPTLSIEKRKAFAQVLLEHAQAVESQRPVVRQRS
jgi:hypothetical protein